MIRLFRLSLALLALCLFGAGCYVPAAQPWLGADALVNVPELVGSWNAQPDGSGESFIIEQDADAPAGTYRITYHEKEKTIVLTGRAGKLGDTLYLDTAMQDFGEYAAESLFHSVPTHNAMRLRFTDDNGTLHYEMVNPEWVEQRVIDGTLDIAHQQVVLNPNDKDHGYLCLVTATSKEMSAFLEKHAADEGFFRKGEPLYRMAAGK